MSTRGNVHVNGKWAYAALALLLAILLALAVLLCTSIFSEPRNILGNSYASFAKPRGKALSTSSATVPPPVPVVNIAQNFISKFASQDFTGQWAELAPQAQNEWPSEPARTSMLEAKFSGADVSEASVGNPVSGSRNRMSPMIIMVTSSAVQRAVPARDAEPMTEP